MKICILGNSVGFRMRPPRRDKHELTYSEILESEGHSVRNISKAGVMLNEVFAFLEEEVITFFPDLVIIHHGIVEVCLRRTWRWSTNKAIKNYYMNRIFSRSYTFMTVTHTIYYFLIRAFNSSTRRIAGLLGLKWQWLTTNKFLSVLGAVVEMILKETNSFIIIVGITSCSDRVERILEGTSSKIAEANAGIRTIGKTFGQRVKYLNPGLIIREDNIANLVSDGIHFSAEGHRHLAEQLLQAIQSFRQEEAFHLDCKPKNRLCR